MNPIWQHFSCPYMHDVFIISAFFPPFEAESGTKNVQTKSVDWPCSILNQRCIEFVVEFVENCGSLCHCRHLLVRLIACHAWDIRECGSFKKSQCFDDLVILECTLSKPWKYPIAFFFSVLHFHMFQQHFWCVLLGRYFAEVLFSKAVSAPTRVDAACEELKVKVKQAQVRISPPLWFPTGTLSNWSELPNGGQVTSLVAEFPMTSAADNQAVPADESLIRLSVSRRVILQFGTHLGRRNFVESTARLPCVNHKS